MELERLPFTTCDTVKLRPGMPRNYQAAHNLTGTVSAVNPTERIVFVSVVFDNGTEQGLTFHDIPANYLEPHKEKVKTVAKRGAFHLHEPRDDRNEDARMDEGVSSLRSYGYEVLEVGQSRTAAICHKCSREDRMAGGKGYVKCVCIKCKSLGYSPSTNSTAGVPDTYVTHDQWPLAVQCGMEWKDGPQESKVRPEQKSLANRGRIVIVWNLPTCLAAVATFERDVIGRKPHAEISAYVAQHSEYLAAHGRWKD